MHDLAWLLAAVTGLMTLGIGAVALLRPALGRWAGAEARYALWLLVPVLLFAAGLARALPQPPVAWQVELPEGEWSARLGVPAVAPPSASPSAQDPAASKVPALLLATWGVGALALSLLLTVQHRRFAQRPMPVGASPVLQGAWRPRVRLPADFRLRFAPHERRLVLLHERVHAERGDTRWTALALGLLVLQWFNPVGWWAVRRWRQDMELAADAAVLRRCPQALPTYRAALLRAQNLGVTPLSVSPCATHPLIERLAMLLATVASVALAVQPQPAPPVPTPPVAQVAPAPAAVPALSAAPTSPASPQSLVKAAPPAAPAVPAVQAPAVAAPPPAEASGYSKLRMDLAVTLNGQRLPPMLLVQTFNEVRPYTFEAAGGRGVRVLVSGRPYTGEAVQGQDLILLEFVMLDAKTGELLAKPRIVTKDNTLAMIERGDEGGDMLRIEVLPRFVQTRLHDATGALAELKRDIEAGQAPALHFN
jgi:beta-lactamase regulating signal transducer with metallopeptidase domain